MTSASITIRAVDGDDTDRIESLLKSNGLPYQDVRTGPGRFFHAFADTEWIGIGGVEIYGKSGLLRSVVVTESNRGQGYGSALCDALEDYARKNEVDALYLLTTSAAAFFRQCGYRETGRETVPPRIQQTTEFSDACPDSATCMRKTLR